MREELSSPTLYDVIWGIHCMVDERPSKGRAKTEQRSSKGSCLYHWSQILWYNECLQLFHFTLF